MANLSRLPRMQFARPPFEYPLGEYKKNPAKALDPKPALNPLAGDSRKAAGNQRFDVWQQTSRPNHFTVVEAWKDQKAYDAHVAAAHYKEFRDKSKPFLISSIDDRLHSGIEPAAASTREINLLNSHRFVCECHRLSAVAQA